jgi:hypothetical protein
MNHIHISINGKTILDETYNNEFDQNSQTKPDDTFYYEGMWGEIVPMKKNSWQYRLFRFAWGSLFVLVFLCLLPYFLFFLFFVYTIILKLLGF